MAEGGATGHVVFVGMMGSGKTTVGRRVARKLDRLFVDTDAELVDTSGREITEWFSEVGEDAFRRAETQVLAEILARPEPHVIATGGGAVLSAQNRDALSGSGHTVIWLRASPAFLASRLSRKADRGSRPLLADDPRAALERLDGERRSLYAQVADIVIDIEPVMADADHPRKKVASLVLDTLEVTGVAVRR